MGFGLRYEVSRRELLKAALGLGVATSAASCAPSESPSTRPAPGQGPGTDRIPILNVSQFDNPTSLTCWDWTAVSHLDILHHFAEPLFRFNRQGQPEGVVVESWEMRSATEWILKLRKGLKFHDPKYGELKAEDVVASLQSCFKPDGRGVTKQPGVVARMQLEIIDDYSLAVHLPKPGLAALPNYWLYTAISSKKYLEEVGTDFNRRPLGTGPYKFIEWVPNVRVVGERFENYWGPDPGVNRLVWRIIPDAFTRKSEFLTGGLDILAYMDASWVPEVTANPNVRVESVLSARYIMVVLPCRRPPFNDKRVRQALNYAVNKEEIVQKLFLGVGAKVPSGIVNPILPEGRPDRVVYPYNPQKAKELLEQARADGVQIGRIRLYSYNDRYPMDKEMGEAVAGYWRAIGLEVEYIPQSSTILSPRIQDLKMEDPFLIGFGNTQLRADYPFNLWLQSRENPRSRGAEYVGGPPEWDAMIDDLASMPTGSPESIRLARQLDDLFSDFAPWVFVVNYVDLYGVNNKVDWKPYSYEARYFIDVKPRRS